MAMPKKLFCEKHKIRRSKRPGSQTTYCKKCSVDYCRERRRELAAKGVKRKRYTNSEPRERKPLTPYVAALIAKTGGRLYEDD